MAKSGIYHFRTAHDNFVAPQEDDSVELADEAARIRMMVKEGKVGLINYWNKWCRSTEDGTVEWNGEAFADDESAQYEVEEGEDGGMAFKSCHGTYLCAQDDGTFVSDREELGPWETFRLGRVLTPPAGLYFLKTIHRNYVVPQDDDDGSIVLGDEPLRIQLVFGTIDGRAGLKWNGKYLCCKDDGSTSWDRDARGSWESFCIEYGTRGRVGFRTTHGTYLCAQDDGTLVCDRESLGSWESFSLENAGIKPGIYFFKTAHENYVAPQEDDSVELADEGARIRMMVKEGKVGFINFWNKFCCSTEDGTVEWNGGGFVDEGAQYEVEEGKDGGMAFKSCHGTYLCAQDDGTLVSDREELGPWETFVLTPAVTTPAGLYFIKTKHGNYVAPQDDDDGSIVLSDEPLAIKLHFGTIDGRAGLKWNGKYLCCKNDGTTSWDRDARGSWESLWIMPGNNGTVGFRTTHGTYLCAQGNGALVCDRESLGSWESFTLENALHGRNVYIQHAHGNYVAPQNDGTFTTDVEEEIYRHSVSVIDVGEGKIALQNAWGKFLGVTEDGGVEWNREELGDEEKLDLRAEKKGITFQSQSGCYLSCQEDGSLTADLPLVGDCELFHVTPLPDHKPPSGIYFLKTAHGNYVVPQDDDDGSITFGDEGLRIKLCYGRNDGKVGWKCHGKYLSCGDDGSAAWNKDSKGSWEGFIPEICEDGGVAFKTVHDTYICAQDDGTLVCDREEVGPWETFTLESAIHGKKIYIKHAHGNFVAPQEDDTVALDFEETKEEIAVTVEDAGDGRVGLLNSFGKYLGLTPDGVAEWNREELGDEEKIEIIAYAENGDEEGIAFKSQSGKFLCALDDGTLVADRGYLHEWSRFGFELAEEEPAEEEPAEEEPAEEEPAEEEPAEEEPAEEEPAEEEPAEEEPAEEEPPPEEEVVYPPPEEEDEEKEPPVEHLEDDVYTAGEAGDEEVDEEKCEDAAKALRKAMKGWGTNEDKMIEAIGDKSYAELACIKQKFTDEIDRDLIKDIKGETRGNFEKLLVGLFTDRAEYDANIVHDALSGIGTNESLLVEVLCTRSPEELKSMGEKYEEIYETEVLTAVENDTSGNFEKLCVLLLEGHQERDRHDDESIEEDIEKLYKAGEKKFGTDEGVFIRMLAGQPRDYVEKLYWAYAEKYGKALDRVVKKEFRGKLEKALVALVTPLDIYFARQFHKSLEGMGTDDSRLIRLVVTQKERNLRKANARYLQQQQQTLTARISSECGGDYKQMIVAIMKNWGNLA